MVKLNSTLRNTVAASGFALMVLGAVIPTAEANPVAQCGKGAAVAAGSHGLLYLGAFTLDLLGGSGLFTAMAVTYTSANIIRDVGMTCAGFVAAEGVDAAAAALSGSDQKAESPPVISLPKSRPITPGQSSNN